MDLIQLAQASGMLVTLDGRIGREEYRSIYGSLAALQRFADAVMNSQGQDSTVASANGVMKSASIPH
jgi:hypothetical protein